MTQLGRLKQNWRQLKRAQPGRRFQDFYEHRRELRSGMPAVARIMTLFGGVALILLAPVVGAVPGPGGLLVFFLGLALVAVEFRVAARFLDWLELKLRKGWSGAKRAWARLPMVGKIVLSVFALGLVCTLGYLTHKMTGLGG